MLKLPPKLREKWIKAIKREIEALVDNKTFALETKRTDEKVTPTLLTCVVKPTAQGTLEKLKVRIVVRGDIQKAIVDEDPWSGTVASRTMKSFLATVAKLKKMVKQIDFISAFLQRNARGGTS